MAHTDSCRTAVSLAPWHGLARAQPRAPSHTDTSTCAQKARARLERLKAQRPDLAIYAIAPRHIFGLHKARDTGAAGSAADMPFKEILGFQNRGIAVSLCKHVG